ncbi:unnamed protein product [Allacma fusca]|uniref:G-patch domain-containing protein n=1 Tax=Allacma fusca TaxID=39272 RepID=A0A8J2PLE4_9HEXA|nr:unnamed protein product [Allacma fusca]
MSAPISFGFSKKVQPKKLIDSKIRDESTRELEEERDFVKSVVGNEIQGTLTKKESKKEWIIPLIRQNNWRSKDERVSSSREEVTGADVGNAAGSVIETLSPEELLEKQALKELLATETVVSLRHDEAGNSSPSETTSFEIPLLLQNKIPGGFEQDDNMDVSLRPEQSTLEDYDEFPVEHFGMAMLRGMGWKETEGIGRTNKGVIMLQEPMLRPKGLGLGAERPQSSKDAISAKAAKSEESKLILKIGAYAKITHGSNKGLYGQVESFDEDNNRLILKLSLTSKMAAISKFHMEVVSESEFKGKSKVLNNEKYEKYKQAHDERDASHRENRLKTDEDFLDMSTYKQRDRPPKDEDRKSSKYNNGRDNDDHKNRSSHHKSRHEDSSSSKRSKKSKKEKKKRRHRSSSSSSSPDDRRSQSKKKRRDSS